jgi:hypothetical protein
MTDNTAPDIVEIAPAADGLNPMAGEGPTTEVVDEKPKEKPSIEDSLKKAFKASEEKEANPKAEKPVSEKPVKEAAPKVEANNVEESAAEKPAVDEKARVEKKPSEGRKFDTAPSRMIPEASAKWANVPNEVKAEVYRAFDDFEREKQTYSEHVKFREELKEYEELGKQHGVSVKDALQNYVGIERKFYESPADGFRQLLSNMNMQPQQAISHILSAFNVTPQALAHHMAQNPQAYTAQPRQVQQPQQSPQVDPNISAIMQKIDNIESKFSSMDPNSPENKAVSTVQNFASSHPDYYDLEGKIAEILKSGIIEKIHGESLPVDKKLSEAYRMAGGQGSSSRFDGTEENQQHSRTEKRPVNPDAGKLSIGGSPNAGDIKSTTRKKAAPSIDDALANAIRRAS